MTRSAYYNEFDPFAAAWLKALIDKGLIARGDVDSRDIRDVRPDDLRGYSQCHFFAGIGGWSVAFRLAGLADDFRAWSGSCPCQPFSSAGKQKGVGDARHLWPDWFRLIRERHPSIIFGEQVANAIKHGWLDAVADDFERESYAVGAAVYPVCAIGAPHLRERLYFVAYADRQSQHVRAINAEVAGAPSLMADADKPGACEKREQRSWEQRRPSCDSQRDAGGSPRKISDANGERFSASGPVAAGANGADEWRMLASSDWWTAEPSVDRMAHGVPNRVGALRGFGNAIVPKAAAEFVAAAMECVP